MIGKYYPLSSGYGDLLGEFDASNATECIGGNVWILTHFGQCVSDGAQWASFVLGFIALLIWFLPTWPQIYQNYKQGSVEEALSPIFLFLWFTGDSLNLAGAVLTKQLPVQIYVSIYFIGQDCIVLGQYLYYKAKNRWRVRLLRDLGESGPRVTTLNGLLLGGVFLFSGSMFYSNSFFGQSPEIEVHRSRTLLAPIFNGATDEVGFTCGTVSAISYLCGRIPQLIKNYKRQSTEGVSMAMYTLICLGNTFYGASVLLGLDGDPLTYYMRHLPWLVGSLGCLFLDSIVYVQYFRYRNLNKADLLPIIDDSIQSDSINDPTV